ncbi:MAG: GTPase [Verrucomicrobiota bacterium]
MFNAVTRTRKAEAANYPFCTIDPNVGIVTVPDARMYELQKIAKTHGRHPGGHRVRGHRRPREGRERRAKGSGNKFLTHIREVDAIVQVVRCFEDADIHHVTGTVDPVRDIEVINTELVLADLETVKKRLREGCQGRQARRQGGRGRGSGARKNSSRCSTPASPRSPSN